MNGIAHTFSRHRPVLGQAALVGLVVGGYLSLLNLSAVGHAERVASIPLSSRQPARAALDPGREGSPPRALGNRHIVTLPDSPPRPPLGLGAHPGLGDAPPPPAKQPRLPAHTLRVWVTGYDLAGITAAGGLAGPGSCAVDPTVIPLGTTITIDGVGSCRADDTGSAVVGAMVDVWVPDARTAYQLTGGYTIHY
ncbi:MAG TPA: 3D domain-containing protein [Chloroflexota bacterium]|nr:3D domain-containing protein [Chloroflexota bacterium]